MLVALLVFNAVTRGLHPGLFAALVLTGLSVISLSATIFGVLVFNSPGGFSNGQLLLEGEGWCYVDGDCQRDLYCYRKDGSFKDSSFRKEFFCYKPPIGELASSGASVTATSLSNLNRWKAPGYGASFNAPLSSTFERADCIPFS